ncbi:MAG: 4-(cytidine 5'-diphospho)-2-C-methyl-D-erythritol kinase [Tissierellia bacterium]|nr:4-(cytidine 5'-diphospho)-2-C-methyl-D-erythritol kinase [Tissierellia bacterium]
MESIVANAFAKLNLGLKVCHKRKDGYHAIKTVFQQIDIYDRIIFEPRSEGFHLNCPNTGAKEDNLIYQAYNMLKRDFSEMKGLYVLVEKNIPVAAGLAGGSADAAATLIALNELYKLNIDSEKMSEYALRLGSDVPFMLQGGSAVGTGRGEELSKIEVPRICGVLINPGFGVSSAEMYSSLEWPLEDNPIEMAIEALEAGDFDSFSKYCGNDLAKPLINQYPELNDYLDLLLDNGAFVAMPSGSGPTLWGLFHEESEAVAAENKLKSKAPFVKFFKTCPKEQGILLERNNI